MSTTDHPESGPQAREWTVHCLRETFVPHGALLMGPEITTGTVLVEHSALVAAEAEIGTLKTVARNVGEERDILRTELDRAEARIVELEDMLGKVRSGVLCSDCKNEVNK